MKRAICKHCGKEIGEWTDPWGGHPEWKHAPDDGPDAYIYCNFAATFFTCTVAGTCSDGEEAEPEEVRA